MNTDQINRRPTGRKIAEWVTLGVSLLLVLGVAAYLCYRALRETPRIVPLEVRVLAERSQKLADRHVVPVEVKNHGHRTLKNVKVKVVQRQPGVAGEATQLSIDFLGEGGVQMVYVYVQAHPRDLPVEAVPVSYELE